MQIAEVIKEQKIDMRISETHLRVVGANEDLSTFKNRTLFCKEKGSLAKRLRKRIDTNPRSGCSDCPFV